MKILVCEDNVVLALDLQDQVQEAGHECLGFVTRASACMEFVARSRPDIVLVDLTLADGRTGPALIEQLNETGIRSIVISGELSFLPPDHSAAAVLAKPLKSGDLQDTLRQLDV